MNLKRTAFLILLLAACNKQPTAPFVEDSDATLQKKLVGVWTSSNGPSVRQFNADYTFVDSGISANPFDGSDRKLITLWHGRYSINHSVLQYADVYPQFFDSLIFDTPQLVFDHEDQEISFANDTLYLKYCEMLSPGAHNDGSLYGTWILRLCRYHYQSQPFSFVYNGRVVITMTFSKNSPLVVSSQEYPDGYYPMRPPMQSYFTYTPPILDYGNTGDDLITVEFSGGKMFWHHDYQAGAYCRSK